MSGVGAPANAPRKISNNLLSALGFRAMSPPKEYRAIMYIPAVDDNYCLWIGNVIVAWGAMETQFNDFLDRLIVASRITPDENWRTQKLEKRLKRYNDLAGVCFSTCPNVHQEVVAIAAEMDITQIDRNLFAHGAMSTAFKKLGTIEGLHVDGRHNGKPVTKTYTMAEIQKIAQTLHRLMGRLITLVHPQLDETFSPGWSPQELSVLRDFRSRSRLTPPKPDTH